MIQKLNQKNFFHLLIASIPIMCITGPFLPDLIVSCASLFFLFYIIKNKKFFLFRNKFFLTFLFFYFILILSSLFSDYLFSLKTSVSYLRFGIFVLLIIFLTREYSNFSKLTLNILMLTFFSLAIDSIVQKVFGYNLFGFQPPYGRITSFFGDDIKLGGFIIRLLPLVISLLIFHQYKNFMIFLILILASFMCVLSGERTSILMIMIFIFFFLMNQNIKHVYKFYIFVTPLILITLLISLNGTLKYRLLTSTLSQINFTKQEPYILERNLSGHDVVLHRDSTLFPRIYHMYYQTTLKIWKDNIFLGSGPRTYKYLSKKENYLTISDHAGMEKYIKINNAPLKDLSEKELNLVKEKIGIYPINSYPGFTKISGANSHPHNIYLQLLSEVGLVGSLFVFVIFLYSLFSLYRDIPTYKKMILIGILINLFPLMFSGNFFNNWLSILYFYPIGYLFLNKESDGFN